MNRREFITLLGGAAAWPLSARAQQPAMPVNVDGARQIGWLMSFAEGDPEAAPRMQAFELGLRQLGWSLDRNVKISYRWTGARSDRADALARDLLTLSPSVLLANATRLVQALQAVTKTVPIVFTVAPDPVAQGLVQTLARPGAMSPGLLVSRRPWGANGSKS